MVVYFVLAMCVCSRGRGTRRSRGCGWARSRCGHSLLGCAGRCRRGVPGIGTCGWSR
ncbi:hypothetical protein ABZT48_09690 [Streptomyces avermitilis]|uniref:hypothetical protein n=1 Tax=Streptomyces avermitilis TaxID=33903 RepID=UPI0033B2C817